MASVADGFEGWEPRPDCEVAAKPPLRLMVTGNEPRD